MSRFVLAALALAAAVWLGLSLGSARAERRAYVVGYYLARTAHDPGLARRARARLRELHRP